MAGKKKVTHSFVTESVTNGINGDLANYRTLRVPAADESDGDLVICRDLRVPAADGSVAVRRELMVISINIFASFHILFIMHVDAGSYNCHCDISFFFICLLNTRLLQCFPWKISHRYARIVAPQISHSKDL